MFADFNAENLPFAKEQLQNILNSDEGKRLIQMLQQSDSASLQRAVHAAKQGDYQTAKSVLEPILASDEAAQIAKKFNKEQG